MEEGMLLSIDRIEGDIAVLVSETGQSYPVSVAELPTEATSGSMVRWLDGVFVTAPEATEKRREYALSLLDKLRKKSNG